MNCFRNRGFVGRDMISQMPEALLLKILSSLPTKTVISTSVLSKQWRSLWNMVPNLEFDSEEHKSEHYTFSEIVSKSFLSHKAPVLESFHLKFGLDKASPVDIGLWIGIAFARHLRELVLEYLPQQQTFIFPSSLCTCNTLETLKLKVLILVDISFPVLMKSLKTLHLIFVSYKDDASIRNLLSGCPSLQDLVVDRGENNYDVETFAIEVPSLQRLSIYDDNSGEEFRGYKIVAPSLKYLQIEELRCREFCVTVPELVEASIINVSSKKFLESLTSAKRILMYLSPLEITYPTGSIFYKLVYLEIYTRKPEWWNLLTLMLESSPKLQFLKVVDPYLSYFHKDDVVGGKLNQPKHVPECLLSHLETFVWERYDWGRKEENEVATYILRNARQLKKATFSTIPIESKELSKLEERHKMLNELYGVIRASNSCQLVFEFDSSNMY